MNINIAFIVITIIHIDLHTFSYNYICIPSIFFFAKYSIGIINTHNPKDAFKICWIQNLCKVLEKHGILNGWTKWQWHATCIENSSPRHTFSVIITHVVAILVLSQNHTMLWDLQWSKMFYCYVMIFTCSSAEKLNVVFRLLFG